MHLPGQSRINPLFHSSRHSWLRTRLPPPPPVTPRRRVASSRSVSRRLVPLSRACVGPRWSQLRASRSCSSRSITVRRALKPRRSSRVLSPRLLSPRLQCRRNRMIPQARLEAQALVTAAARSVPRLRPCRMKPCTRVLQGLPLCMDRVLKLSHMRDPAPFRQRRCVALRAPRRRLVEPGPRRLDRGEGSRLGQRLAPCPQGRRCRAPVVAVPRVAGEVVGVVRGMSRRDWLFRPEGRHAGHRQRQSRSRV
jgi:hypothetical protein